MFTGIIQSLGRVSSLKNGRLLIDRPSDFSKLSTGESIAVDGVCLTLEKSDSKTLSFRLLPETVRTTTLGSLKPHQPVHLERALRLGDRLGGHWLLGHVDAQVKLAAVHISGDSKSLEISFPERLRPFLVPKGPVALDGVSLTVGDSVGKNRFSVHLVAHTLSVTQLGSKKPGDSLNLELDLVAKYLHGMTA
jgi:riboflavin synthase